MDNFPSPPDFPSNNRQSSSEPPEPKTDQRKIGKIVEGSAVVRKKSLSTRVRNMFFGGDHRSVIDVVTSDVMLPALRDMIAEAATQAVERVIFGETRSTSRRSSNRTYVSGQQTNYSRYSSTPQSNQSSRSREDSSFRRRSSRDMEEFVVTSRMEAEAVLERLDLLIEKFSIASIGDLRDMLGMSPQFTDEKWGWSNLAGSRVHRVTGNEYVLVLPSPEPID